MTGHIAWDMAGRRGPAWPAAIIGSEDTLHINAHARHARCWDRIIRGSPARSHVCMFRLVGAVNSQFVAKKATPENCMAAAGSPALFVLRPVDAALRLFGAGAAPGAGRRPAGRAIGSCAAIRRGGGEGLGALPRAALRRFTRR